MSGISVRARSPHRAFVLRVERPKDAKTIDDIEDDCAGVTGNRL